MSFDNKRAVVHTDHRTIPTKYSIVYLLSCKIHYLNKEDLVLVLCDER